MDKPIIIQQLTVGTPEFTELLATVRKATIDSMQQMDGPDEWITTEEAMRFVRVKNAKSLYDWSNEPGSGILHKDGRWLKSSIHQYMLNKCKNQ